MIRIEYKGHKENIAYQTELSVGADLYAEESVEIQAGDKAIIPTGVFIKEFQEVLVSKLTATKSMPVRLTPCLQVVSRSGLAAKFGVCVLNSPGIIDADYRDEIKVILINLGKNPFIINKGDRIAQLIGSYAFKIDGVDTLQVTRTGGLGSSGV